MGIIKLVKFQIFSIVFVMILGTLLHFTYNWSGDNYIVGAFSAVNESVWEHLKLLFFPMLITTIIGMFSIGKLYPRFLCARAIGILSAMLFTVVFFYTYSGVIGTDIAFLNILSFFIAVLIGEYVSFKFTIKDSPCNTTFAMVTLTVLLVCFVAFTYKAPHIGIFKDPVTGTYGLS